MEIGGGTGGGGGGGGGVSVGVGVGVGGVNCTGSGSTKKLKSKRHCRVLFNYLPNHDDELFLQVDDIIEIIAEVEEGWWQGRLKGKIGVFPSNFVTEIDYFTNAASTATTTPAVSVVPNAKIDDKRTNETTATVGAVAAAAAVAPSVPDTPMAAAVSVSPVTSAAASDATDESLTKCTIPKTAGKTICIAKYLYNAKNADELSLREGDLITLLSTETQDKGWWLGEVNGKKGVFPDNFVMLANFDQNSQTFHHRKEFAKNAAAAAAAAAAAVASSTASSGNSAGVTNTTNYQNNNVTAQRESLQGGNVSTRLAFTKKSAAVLDFDGYESFAGGGGGGGGAGGCGSGSVDIRNGSVSHIDGGNGGASSRKTFNNELDDVERTIILTDLRASRAKPPKRRPPTSTGPDDISLADTPVHLDHNQNSFLSPSEKSNQNENIYDAISETNVAHVSLTETNVSSNSSMNRNSNNSSNASIISNSSAVGQLGAESGGSNSSGPSATPVSGSLTRSKIKEWEKHKVPWIDELKLNQKTKKIQPALPASPSVATAAALTSSSSPAASAATTSVAASASASNINLPPEISCSINITVPSYAAPPASFANTHHSSDVVTDAPQKPFAHLRETIMSLASLSSGMTPATATTTTTTTTTTTAVVASPPPKPTPKPTRLFPPFSNSSNISSTSDKDNNNENCEDNSPTMLVERSKFESLQNRVSALETLMASSFHEFSIVIDELKAKLEIEKDLRNLLQVQFEKLLHANKMKQI